MKPKQRAARLRADFCTPYGAACRGMLGMVILTCMGTAMIQTDLAFGTAKDSRSVGYIEVLHGSLDAFSIERQGRAFPPALLLPIQAGDRVHVRGGGNLLTLRCGSKAIKVTTEESPYVIPVSAAPPGFVARLGDVLIALAARLQQQQAKAAATVSLSGRGEEITLTMPLLDEQRSKLRSDVTRVFLAWRGGTPPYRVRVTSLTTDADLARVETLEEPRVGLQLAMTPMPIGTIEVDVQDSAGGRASSSIEIVPSHGVPVIPKSLSDQDMPAELKRVLAADWLSRQNRREWGFQAYQLAAQDASSFEPARLLRDCLEELQDCYKR